MKFSLLWLIWVGIGWALIPRALAGEIGFVETFALSPNRADALKQLIPGTEEYYFYSCLQAQNTGDFTQVTQLLKLWIERYNYTPQVKEILNRQALLEYEKNPKRSLEHIRNELNLRFDHEREVSEAQTSLPTELDQNLIGVPALTQAVFAKYDNLEGVEDAGLDILDHDKLDPLRRRNLLARLQRPDIPNLPKLVVEDLRYEHSAGFGSHPIHRNLLRDQLDECVKLMPELADNSNFVQTYLTKLAPSDDIVIQEEPAEKKAYLLRLWTYVKGLAPVHNSLKAHILYALLDFNRSEGHYDPNLFMEYLQLPRQAPYVNPDYLNLKEFRDVRANLAMDFQHATRLKPVGSDEELVKDYLAHFLVDAPNYNAYTKYIRDRFLKSIFAETKIVNGVGDMEQWYSMMTPEQYQALKDRVDLDFALTNQSFFSTDEPVRAELFIKNVNTLIVKIFELNTFNYYASSLQEIDTTINLDGLVASEETVLTYDEPPLRRVRRTYEFPQINRPGVFVIEFIGGGKSSRMMVRKGRLFAADRIGPSGHEWVILNEKNEPRPQATIWLSGREFKPGTDGVITIPFSTQPGKQKIILKDNGLCSLAEFDHQAESYSLSAGFFVERESLLKRFTSKVMVRPVLTLNHHPVSLSLLENIRLTIESVDRQGVSTIKEVSPFEVFEGKESLLDFQVPDNLAVIRFTLTAQVKNLSLNKKVDVSDSAEFALNGIDAALSVEDVFLTRSENGYTLEVLGKNGESKAARPIHLEIKHRYFREPVYITLQSDSKGRIRLGQLINIDRIKVTGPEGASHVWSLSQDLCRYPQNLHGTVGKPIRVPYMGVFQEKRPQAEKPALPRKESRISKILSFVGVAHSAGEGSESHRLSYVLLEKRGPTWIADRTDAVSVADGFLEINGLSAGDYDLFIKSSQTKITLRLTEAQNSEGPGLKTEGLDWLVPGRRVLEIKDPNPLQIRSVEIGGSAVTVKLAHATDFTRVHVLATRYLPMYSPFAYLSRIGLPEPWQARMAKPETLYVAGRNIGDEYRYILDRRYVAKFPGNMLERPGLLLNPWNIRKTETTIDQAGAGEAYAKRDGAMDTRVESLSKDLTAQHPFDSFSNLDFLAEPTAMILNLKPDANGTVTMDRKQLGAHTQIHILAVDPIHTVYRSAVLPDSKVMVRDLRLLQGLNAEKHFTEQKQISVFNTGETFTLADNTSSEIEIYDTVGSVWRLMTTLSGNNPTLQEFEFIPRWQDMTRQEKLEKYNQYACHELHFFIWHKDREFFDQIIQPYIANKKHKTFMDQWLLNEDLSDYLQPWSFNQLNIVEKILLSKQGPGDKARIERYVKELADMIPYDADMYNRLFDIALKGRALEGDTSAAGAVMMSADKDGEMSAVMSAPPMEPEPYMLMMEETRETVQSVKPAPMPSADAKSAAPAKMMRMKEQKADTGGDKGAYFKPRAAPGPQEARPFYQKLDKTLEWAENNYYKLPIESQKADLITANAFWKDYAQHPAQGKQSPAPFLSPNFIYATKNFTEIMLAISVLDLPFKAGTHETHIQQTALTLKTGSPLIIFHKEIKEGRPAQDKIPILITQHIFNPHDRYRFVDNEQFDKFIEGECLIRSPYGCQVVMSNPTSSRHKLRILLQIPRSAIPIANGFYTKSIPITLEPFSTQTIEYFFYFPESGKFTHYPAQVSKNEQYVSSASPAELNAVVKLSKVDTASWDYISQNSSDADVLEYLRTHNINRLNLDKIAFRMKDKGFFDKAIALLQERHTFHPTLYAYSVFHNAAKIIPEYLKHTDFANQCGDYINTPLLQIDPIARKTFDLREFKPLVNARAHQLGSTRKILNDRFHDQYLRFMKLLSYYPSLTDDHRMTIAYYLLLQDRVDEAMKWYQQIDAGKIHDRIQYDYLKTYMAFYQEDFEQAKALIAQYRDYPVPRWQRLFTEAANQLEELEGKSTDIADQESRDQVQAKLASTEPGLELSVEARKITIAYHNLTSCRISYYPMDIELLFSRNPFVQQQTEYFAFIKPRESTEIQLPEGQKRLMIDLPQPFHNSNLMIEATAGGIRKSQVYYANSLDIQVVENYGQVKVYHQTTHKPLSKVYVKVYVKMKDGTVQFYKDGYTDLRGRFDYASLNTNEMDAVEKLAILVLSEAYGAAVKEASPPKR